MKYPYAVSEYVRNPEVKKQLGFFLLVGAAAALGAALVWPNAGIPISLVWAVMGMYHFIASYFRYHRIAALSSEIDRILHMEEIVLLSHMEEGELSILEDEVNKMLIRLREQNKELRHEKSYLADSLADLSHQLRTPLTAMNLIFSILETEYLSSEELLPKKQWQQQQQDYFRKLQSLLRKVQWLIDVLLKISKLDADAVVFQKKSYLLCELIREASVSVEIPMELKGQTLEIRADRDAVFSGDLKWTIEAVENILKNCMEHTPEGGKITVSATENTIYSELVIEDNGEGIAKEDLPHLFERFYKGKNSSEESAGIGLALANMILTKQNGILRAENGKDGGARFLIRFYKESQGM